MKTFFLVFGIFIACATGAFAQKVSVNFGGNYQYFPKNKWVSEYEGVYNFASGNNPEDSIYYLDIRRIFNKLENTYKTKPGLVAGFNLDWKFNDKWGFRSGLGINTVAFTVMDDFIGVETYFIRIDTIMRSGSGTTIFGNSNCIYTNSVAELGEIDHEIRYQTFFLDLPFQLTYDLIPGKMGIALGGNISTPVSVSRRREFVTIERHETTSGTTCTYVKVEENNKSGHNFRDLNIGLKPELYVQLEDIGIAISIEKRLTNVFVDKSEQESPAQSFVARPWIGSVKVFYGF